MENTLPMSLGTILIWMISLTAVSFIIIMILWFKLTRMQRRYLQLLNGHHPENIEQLLIDTQQGFTRLSLQNEENEKSIKQIKKHLKIMKSNVGLSRYNAFAQEGNDLSFSMAILDEEKDGVIITGIHNREQSYFYAKPIEKGQSKYSLSPEEKEVISQTASKLNL